MKKLIGALFVVMAMFNCNLAHATVGGTVTGLVTGDNNLYYWTGSTWKEIDTNWESPVTLPISVTSTNDIVYFAVSNNVALGSSDPAGLLAQFTAPTGYVFTATNSATLLSNSSTFKIATIAGAPVLSPTLPVYDWDSATNIALNDTGTWESVDNSTLGISSSADWIWTKNDNGNYFKEDDYAIFAVNLGLTASTTITPNGPIVTPEPTTVLLFVFAGAMLVIFRKRLGIAR
jgi:hypothetical protein